MASATFTKKCLLPSKRVCLRLKALRKEKKMSIEQLARKTRIGKEYLIALEECRFDDVKHSRVYQKNFIKKYVTALGEDPQSFLDQFNTEELKQKKCAHHPDKGCSKTSLRNIPNVFRFFAISIVVLGLLGYLGSHIYNIMQPPELTLISPIDGYITQENNVSIKGTTQPETKVMVNNEPISNDAYGNFEENINLSPGINTLIIQAENKHGKITEKISHVIYKDNKLITN